MARSIIPSVGELMVVTTIEVDVDMVWYLLLVGGWYSCNDAASRFEDD